MTTKVKGLLKGLRYISQIFDEKEEEIQIGFPTDVKHVAHIGWDGPSANAPSWMNEFRSPSELSSGPLEAVGQLSSQGNQDSSTQTEVPRSRLHHSTNLGSESNSPTKKGSDSAKHSRRRRSTADASTSSPGRDSSGSARHSRRNHKSNLGSDSTAPDQPSIPKSSRRKKGSMEGGGSTRSSRSKGQNSLTDIQYLEPGPESESGHQLKQNEGCEGQVRRE